MKKWMLLTIGVLLIAGTAGAQEKYMELLRQDINTEKVAVVTEALDMTEEQAELFWPIYREYELESAKIGDTTLKLIKGYAADYGSMTDVKSEELAKATFKNDEARTKLQKKYFGKMTKAVGATMAARWMQVERAINLLIRVQIAAELPLIE